MMTSITLGVTALTRCLLASRVTDPHQHQLSPDGNVCPQSNHNNSTSQIIITANIKWTQGSFHNIDISIWNLIGPLNVQNPSCKIRIQASSNIMKAQRIDLPPSSITGLASWPLSDLVSVPAASILQGWPRHSASAWWVWEHYGRPGEDTIFKGEYFER